MSFTEWAHLLACATSHHRSLWSHLLGLNSSLEFGLRWNSESHLDVVAKQVWVVHDRCFEVCREQQRVLIMTIYFEVKCTQY